jgi:uncharacterized protein YacL
MHTLVEALCLYGGRELVDELLEGRHAPPMVQILFPALAAVIGLLVYVLSSRPEVKMLGLIIFSCGFFVCTLVLAHESLTLFR